MPKYSMVGPDGNTYVMDAPEGVTPEQAQQRLRQRINERLDLPETPPAQPEPEGEEPGFFTEARREFVRGTGRALGAYGKVLEEAPEILGSMAGIAGGPSRVRQDLINLGVGYLKSATGYGEAVAPTVQAIRETGRGISESVAPRQIGDIYQEYEKDGILGALESAAVTGAGSLPGLLASIGTGLATRSPVAAGTVLTAAYAPQEYEGIRQTQAETGFGGVDEAVAGTAAIMAMDTLTGIGGKILSSVGRDVAEQEIKRGIVSAAREVLRTGRREAGTEAIQTLIGQVAGGEDPTTKESLKQIFESAVVGAVTGTAVGAPIEAGTRIARRRAEKPTEEQVAAAGRDVDTEFANLIRQEAILRMQENPDLDGDAAINQVIETEGLPKSLYDQAVQNVQGRKADATDVTDDAEPVPGGVESGVPAPSGRPAVESEATGQPELPLGRGLDVGSPDVSVDTGGVAVSQPALDIAPIQQPKIKLAERVKAAEPVAIAALDIVTGGQVVEGLNGNTRRSVLATAKNTMAQKAAKGVEFDPVNEVRSAFKTKGIALPEVPAAPEVTTTPEVTAAPAPTTKPTKQAFRDAKEALRAAIDADPRKPRPTKQQFNAMASRLVGEGRATPEGFQTEINKFLEANPMQVGKGAVRTELPAAEEAAPVTEAAAPLTEEDIATSATWYDGGSRTATAGTKKPAWVPDDTVLYDSIIGERTVVPTEDESTITLDQFRAKDGTSGTRLSVQVPSPDRVFGDRGNTAEFSFWLRNTKKEDINVDAIADIAKSLARQVADANKQSSTTVPKELERLKSDIDKAIKSTLEQGRKAAPAKETKEKLKQTISKAPGKTVAEKVFNIAQAELEATPKDDLIEQADVTPYDPEYETIRAKPGINAVRMAKMLGPQLYGDPTNMGQVSIKEVLQNSFDATRSAVDNGQIELGTIDIRVSDDGRTLTVKDNGVGMTPEILGGKFLEIAGTGKEGDKNAGGFGIAKMLFLYANKNIRVVTARDGRIAEMNVTGEQLFESLDDPEQAPDIEIRDFEPVDYEAFPVGHGTIIQLTIPEQDGDYKIKELPGWLDSIPALKLSPLFSNIEVTFQGRSYKDPETVEVGASFPIQDYTQFVGVKFPWGTAKVYITRNETGQKRGENMHILSNGLWQFSTTVKKDPSNMWSDIVPYRFYVDIVPSVKPDQPGYPFNFNRQNFTDDAKSDFGKVKSYIDAIYAYKSRAGEATSFGNIQYFDANGVLGPTIDLTPDIPVQDTSFTRVSEGDQITVGEDGSLLVNGQPMSELTPDQLKAGIPSEKELIISPDLIDTNAVMVHDNADVVIQSTGERMPIPEFMRRQFGERFDAYTRYVGETFLTLRNEVSRVMGYKGLLDEAVGISLDPEYRGVSIRLPFSGSFVNPLVPKYADALRPGFGIWGTMIHELAHHKVRSHNAAFPAEMQDIDLNMDSDSPEYQLRKREFAETVRDLYGDIVQFGVEIFNGANPDITVELRGNRFTEGSGEQVPDAAGDSGAGDVRGPSGAGSTGEPLLGPTYERRRDAGAGEQRGAGAGQSAEQFGEKLKLSKTQIARAKERAGASGRKINKIQRTIAQTKRAQSLASAQVELGKAAKGEEFNLNVLAAAFPNLSDTAQRAILQLLPTVDVMRLANKKNIKGLDAADKLVTDDMRRFDVRENERLAEELETLSRTFKKNPKGVEALMDVMVAAVGHDVDPSLAPTPEEYAAKHDKKYQQRQAALAADPKSGGLKSSLSRRMNEIKSVYAGLADGNTQMPDGEGIAGWTDLNPALKRAFVLMKKAHRRDLEGYFDGLKQRVKDQITDPEGQQAALAELDKQFKPILDNAIYFPMMRHGRFFVRTSETVGGKPQPGFYMFETNAEAQKFTKEMSSVEGVEVLENGKVEDYQKRSANRGADPLAKAINMLGQGTNASELRNELSRLYLSTIPGNSMKARFAKRKLRAGYSTDIMKSFMSARQSNKNARKSINFAHKLDTAISSAKDALAGSPDQQSKRNIIREIELRTTAELNPQPAGFGWDAITRLGNKAAFYWYLATPKSALIQLTQMHIVSLPMLAGKYGHAASTAALTKYGFTGLGQVIKSPITALSRDADGNVEWNWEQPKIINSDLLQSLHKNDRNMQEVLTEGWEEGRDTNLYMETFASDIVGAGEISTESLAKDGMTTTLRSFRNVAGFMAGSFHQMERVNREATYMAALELGYRKNIKDGMPHEEAKQKAIEDAKATTLEATFDFSEYNKPRIMTSNVGRLALQFYMYPVSMFSLLGRSSFGAIKNYKDAAKNIADPELRNKLIAQANSDALVAAGMLFNVALYGGLTALPFFSVGAVLTELFYQAFGDDEDFTDPETGAIGPGRDAEYWFRNEWIPGFFGPGGTVANALGLSDGQAQMLALAAERGPISALTNIDLTNSVALDFFWFVPEQPRADTPELQLAEMLYNTLGGAAAGVTADVAKSLQQLSEGEILKSIETAPRFIGNIAKAIRYKTEGQNTMADLEVGLPAEMYTNTEMFLQMAGFASTAAAKELESGYGLKKVLQAAKDAKASIREDAAEIAADDARSESNADFNSPEWQDVFGRMLEHNRRYPDNILLPSELQESYLNKYFGIRESEAGLGIEFEDLKSSRAALREFERRRVRRENK